ncbi:MAG: dihydroxyacetone kinase phosphoryl donor subunit DhaM [Culicoidibacterales bacterium]
MEKGIVIVSHVSQIAFGIKKLMSEIAKNVPITAAGGLENDEIGTSMEAILEAIESNDAEEIFAFYDLGSAKMNLDMAAELSSKKVTIYPVAIVEGTYVATALIQANQSTAEIEKQLMELKIK